MYLNAKEDEDSAGTATPTISSTATSSTEQQGHTSTSEQGTQQSEGPSESESRLGNETSDTGQEDSHFSTTESFEYSEPEPSSILSSVVLTSMIVIVVAAGVYYLKMRKSLASLDADQFSPVPQSPENELHRFTRMERGDEA